jgi:hypothetical protein
MPVSTKKAPTVLEQVPLWRVQWMKLLGYQRALNCHVPHYTHMFHHIVLNDPKPWLFGHLFLPEGSENLDSAANQLPQEPLFIGSKSTTQVTVTGMQVTNYQQFDDGHLALIVQVLDQF